MKKIMQLSLVTAAALALAGCASGASGSEDAGSYPSEQIRLIIPYGPGGATDVNFRTALPYVEEAIGQTVVPINMPGASATLGSRDVKTSDPDGYTILGSHETIIATKLSGVVDYSIEAFEPVAQLAEGPAMGVVGKDSGWETAKDFVDYVTANPGKVTWGVVPGSTSHFFAQMMIEEMGLPDGALRIVSYDGTAPALAAIQAGDLDGTMAAYADAGSLLEGGAVKSLGVAHDERLEVLPNEETFIEQGIDLTYGQLRGVFAPKGTPAEVVQKLDQAFKSAVENPEYQQEIRDLGAIPSYLPSAEYAAVLTGLENEFTKLSKNMGF